MIINDISYDTGHVPCLPKKRDKLISEFKKRGISIRQISRLTGTSKGIVEKT